MDFAALLYAEKQRAARAGAPNAGAEAAPAADAPRPGLPDAVRRPEPEWMCAEQPPPLELNLRAIPEHVGSARDSPGPPNDVHYVRGFLSAADESALHDRIRHPAFARSWRELRGRALLNFGGMPTAGGIAPEPLPQFCAELCAALVRAGVFLPEAPPNHVLVNEYRVGQGLMPHQDGPLYRPLVAIVSLGGPAMLDFWESAEHAARGRAEGGAALPSAAFLCEPRSLLVFHGDAYGSFLHGIAERSADSLHEAVANVPPRSRPGSGVVARGPRVSLTVRRVPAAGEHGAAFGPGPAVRAAQAVGDGGCGGPAG